MMALLLLLAACGPPDPDATGARWDTGTDPRPTTTDPQTLTVIDTATTVVTGDTGGDPGLCLGDGDPRVRIGTGGLLAFDPYDDGERVPIVVGGSGELGVRLDLLSEGLDTTENMNVILRVSVDGDGSVPAVSEEYLALVRMQCPVPGPGWIQVFAVLHQDLQGPAGAGDLSGMGARFALSLIDKHREEDTVLVDVVFD